MEQETKTYDKPKSRIVVYTPSVGDPIAVDALGKHFVAGVPVELTDEEQIAKVDGNPHFSFEGQDKVKEREEASVKAAEARDAERAAMIEAEAKEMELRHAQERNTLERKHKAEADRLEGKRAAHEPKAAPPVEQPVS